MNLLQGNNRGSFITGRSVHNQRIERLWRDVHKEVTQNLYAQFYAMEDGGKLDPDNDVHRFALHFVFLPHINNKLEQFRLGWNNHRLRTCNGKTPNQLWVDGLTVAHNTGNSSSAHGLGIGNESLRDSIHSKLLEMGINPDSSATRDSSSTSTTTNLNLSAEQTAEMNSVLAPIADLNAKFEACVQKVEDFLHTRNND